MQMEKVDDPMARAVGSYNFSISFSFSLVKSLIQIQPKRLQNPLPIGLFIGNPELQQKQLYQNKTLQ